MAGPLPLPLNGTYLCRFPKVVDKSFRAHSYYIPFNQKIPGTKSVFIFIFFDLSYLWDLIYLIWFFKIIFAQWSESIGYAGFL